jgi:hypothetical protein
MPRNEKLLRIGDLVVAVKEIREVEEGYPELLHARPGDVGQVVHIGDLAAGPTVMFAHADGRATAVDCVEGLEVVRWGEWDATVRREVALG